MNTVDEEIATISSIVASRLNRRHHDTMILDADDVKQELWIWAHAHREKIEHWLDPDQEPEDYQRGLHALEKSMYRQGDRQCRTLRARRCGYEPRDEAFYNIGELENLLPDAWDSPADLAVPVADGMPRSRSNPAESGTRVVTMFDVQVALKRLDTTDQELLRMRFGDSLEPHEIAELFGTSKATVYRNVRQALRRMSNILGGENPWR